MPPLSKKLGLRNTKHGSVSTISLAKISIADVSDSRKLLKGGSFSCPRLVHHGVVHLLQLRVLVSITCSSQHLQDAVRQMLPVVQHEMETARGFYFGDNESNLFNFEWKLTGRGGGCRAWCKVWREHITPNPHCRLENRCGSFRRRRGKIILHESCSITLVGSAWRQGGRKSLE